MVGKDLNLVGGQQPMEGDGAAINGGFQWVTPSAEHDVMPEAEAVHHIQVHRGLDPADLHHLPYRTRGVTLYSHQRTFLCSALEREVKHGFLVCCEDCVLGKTEQLIAHVETATEFV